MKSRNSWIIALALLLLPAIAIVLLVANKHPANPVHASLTSPTASAEPTATSPRATPTPGSTQSPAPAGTPTPGASPVPSPPPPSPPPPSPAPPGPTPPPSPTATLDDEFATLNTGTWAVLDRPGDSSNSELQCYSPSNAAVSGGALVLSTRVAASSCHGYSSAMVQWRTFNFTYGTIEIRAKEAGGKGTWPALWLLGVDCQQTNITTADSVPPCNWPAPGSDEIDITEIMGADLTHVAQSLHTNGYNDSCSPSTQDVSQNWHVYTLVWQRSSLVWKIDGVTTCTMTSNVPSHPMFLIMNTAVGGVGGGAVDNSTLPQTHSIDYVRVSPAG